MCRIHKAAAAAHGSVSAGGISGGPCAGIAVPVPRAPDTPAAARPTKPHRCDAENWSAPSRHCRPRCHAGPRGLAKPSGASAAGRADVEVRGRGSNHRPGDHSPFVPQGTRRARPLPPVHPLILRLRCSAPQDEADGRGNRSNGLDRLRRGRHHARGKTPKTTAASRRSVGCGGRLLPAPCSRWRRRCAGSGPARRLSRGPPRPLPPGGVR